MLNGNNRDDDEVKRLSNVGRVKSPGLGLLGIGRSLLDTPTETRTRESNFANTPPTRGVQTPPVRATTGDADACTTEMKVREPTEVATPAGGKQAGTASLDSSESRTCTEDMCRYCFQRCKSHDNKSACMCKGRLCETCLAREMELTLNRRDGVMKCTVCHFEYELISAAQMFEQQWEQQLKFAWSQLLCCGRDPTRFDEQFFLVRPQIAWMFIAAIMIWLIVTVVSEFVDKMRPFGDTRIISYMIDLILARQLYEVSQQFDVPERAFLGLCHLCRLLVLIVVITFRVFEAARMKVPEIPTKPDAHGHFHVHTKAMAMLIAAASTWYALISLAYFSFEVYRLKEEIAKRARRELLRNRQISIKTRDGRILGPFTLQDHRAENASDMQPAPPAFQLPVVQKNKK